MINDEEFICLLNSLSNSIKDFNRNNKQVYSNIYLNTDSLNEQTLFAKSVLNDIMLYLNQTIKLKLNYNTNEKYLRDKLFLIGERLERINELKNNIVFDFTSTQKHLNDFYENAKDVFRKMREIHNHKIEEIKIKGNIQENQKNNINNSQYINLNEKLISENAVIKFKYEEMLKENKQLKVMLNHKGKDFRIRNFSFDSFNDNNKKKLNSNNGVNITSIKKTFNIAKNDLNNGRKNLSVSSSNKKRNRHYRNPSNGNSIPVNTSNNSFNNNNNNTLTVSTQSNYSVGEIHNTNHINNKNNHCNSNKTINTSSINNYTCNNNNNTVLASLVISFLTHMKNLQDSISSKSTQVKEMKFSFEIKKKQLKKTAQQILGVSSTQSQVITMANNSLINSPREQSINELTTTVEKFKKEVSDLQNEIASLNKEISELKAEIVVKEEKLKNEKVMSKICEETLTNEKIKNKSLNDKINEITSINQKYENEISQLKTAITDCNNNIISISTVNENIIKEKDKLISSLNNNLTKENKELKNKIAQIKNEYITHQNEEFELIKQKLIEINNDAAISLLMIRERLNKSNKNKVGNENEVGATNNNPNKTLSNINEQNSNFIDDELSSVSGIFLEEKKENEIQRSLDNVLNQQLITKTEPSQTGTIIAKNTEQSSTNLGTCVDNYQLQSNLKMLEENEVLLKNQLDLLKIEIKKTREERDELKVQLQNENISNKNENLIMLRQTFEKLIDCIQVTGKIKEYIIMILKLLSYNEDDIQKILNKKDKKNLFNLFG